MARVPIDLSQVTIQDGTATMTVTKVTHQVLVGDKWNKDGTRDVDDQEWMMYPEDHRRIRLELTPVGKPAAHIWTELYMKKEAAGFLERWCTACGVPYDVSGFDTNDFLNKMVLITVATKTDDYGDKQVIAKFAKA